MDGVPPPSWLMRRFDVRRTERRVIAGFGIATHAGVRIAGETLTDEEVLGRTDYAFGTNTGMGAAIRASVHIDGLVHDATFALGGWRMVEGGRIAGGR